MPLFQHDSTGERVLTAADTPEGRRLAGDPAWSELTDPPEKPRPRRRPKPPTPAPVVDEEDPAPAPEGDGPEE